MNDLQEALSACYPSIPETITLVDNERKTTKMDTSKLKKWTVECFAVVGAIAIGAVIFVGVNHADILDGDALGKINEEEKGHIYQIKRYCFVPGTREEKNCKLWRDRYKTLVSGVVPTQLEPMFNAESAKQLADSLHERGIIPRWEATAEAATLPGKSQGARQ